MDDVTTPESDAPATPPDVLRSTSTTKRNGSTQTMNWYDRSPINAQMFMQFGFAGMFVVVFMYQFRDNAMEARANREMYRDEQAAMRAEINKVVEMGRAEVSRVVEMERARGDKLAAQMTEVVFELKRTTDALRSTGLKLEKAVDKMEFDQGILPPPRSVPLTVTGPGGSP